MRCWQINEKMASEDRREMITVPPARFDTATYGQFHGNGQRESGDTTTCYDQYLIGEDLTFWEDLSSAGLIAEQFTKATRQPIARRWPLAIKPLFTRIRPAASFLLRFDLCGRARPHPLFCLRVLVFLFELTQHAGTSPSATACSRAALSLRS